MNELLKLFLSLSLSGSVLIVLIYACCRLLRNHLSKGWQYYIWLVVVLRLLLPFAPETGLLPALWQGSGAGPVQVEQVGPTAQSGEQNLSSQSAGQISAPGPTASPAAPTQRPMFTAALPALRYLWVVWLTVAIGLMIRKVTLYQSFAKYLKAGHKTVDDLEVLDTVSGLCEKIGIRHGVELHTNALVASPLMMGFVRPAIVLSDIPGDSVRLQHICLHELTHYKRGDIYYKWLVQIVLCLHWFNPLVHLMVREMNRTCELSCDEAVLRMLDEKERRQYGDTLLGSLQTPGTYREGLAALTLNEGAQSVKERLDGILKYKKPTRSMTIAAGLLAVLLFVGGYALGAYRGETADAFYQQQENTYSDEGLPIMSAQSRVAFETYVGPIAVTGVLHRNWSPEDFGSLFEAGSSDLMTLVNALAQEVIQEYQDGQIPASLVEEILCGKFPLFPDKVREVCGDIYRADTDTYEYAWGLGGGPAIPIVTGYERNGGLLSIRYTWYLPDPAADEFRYLPVDSGELMVELDGEDFRYRSNRVIPGDGGRQGQGEPQAYSEFTDYARTLMKEGSVVFKWYYSDAPYEELWVAADAPGLELENGYYKKVGRFQSIDQLKAATEAVFTKEFCEANFYPLLAMGKFREIGGALYVGGQGGVPEGGTTPPKAYALHSAGEEEAVLTAICEGPDPNAHNPSAPLIEYSFQLVLRKVKQQTPDSSPIDCWRADSYYSYDTGGFRGDLLPYGE